MARVKLEIPKHIHYTTELPLRISDINYGGHLGNDAVLSLIHEVCIRFLLQHKFTEFDIDGVGIIMSDAVLVFKSESFYGETVRIDVAVDDIQKHGCDIFYTLKEKETGREIARAKTGIVFFNYQTRKLALTPERFHSLFT